jgi:hypothetical protein
MKNFSLMLFSEQTQSGVKDTSAAAVQTNAIDTSVSRTDDVTGDTAPAAGEVTTAPKTRREIYDEFIRANKDFFTEDTQKIINLRVKETGKLKAELEEAGVTIKSLRDELESKTRSIKPPSEDFLASHPDFVLESELENETFKQIYESGVSVSAAFNAAHFDELIESARHEAVKATLDNIRARGSRTRESASSSSASLNVKRDVSRLTRTEREQIARRVMAGEDIIFT